MNKTQIEWARNPDGSQGYTWNPITGCLNHDNGLCKGGGFPCYAYKLANGRLKQRYLQMPKSIYDNVGITIRNEGKLPKDYIFEPDPFAPRLWGHRLEDRAIWQKIDGMAKPKGIFVCDMGELFGEWVPIQWQLEVFEVMRKCVQHRFYLLTKQPQNLIKFSPFPENCWIGVTATDGKMAYKAATHLRRIEAKVKFISFEPLLNRVFEYVGDKEYLLKHINWLIVGQQTPISKKTEPKIEWVREIVEAADRAGIPVFLKNNLKPLIGENLGHTFPGFAYNEHLRQEMPNCPK